MVAFLSGAEVYNTSTPAASISSASYTPHANCETVVVCIMGATEGGDSITGLTVTLDGNSPDEEMNFNTAGSNDQWTWIGRWDGAPSGTLSISADGVSNNLWSALIAYGMSLDTVAIFGDSFTVDHQSAATSTGEQSLTAEEANSLLIFAVSLEWENSNPVTPDGTHTYTEQYEGTTGGTSVDITGTVGTKSMSAPGSYSVEADWVTSEPWACRGVELRWDPAMHWQPCYPVQLPEPSPLLHIIPLVADISFILPALSNYEDEMFPSWFLPLSVPIPPPEFEAWYQVAGLTDPRTLLIPLVGSGTPKIYLLGDAILTEYRRGEGKLVTYLLGKT